MTIVKQQISTHTARVVASTSAELQTFLNEPISGAQAISAELRESLVAVTFAAESLAHLRGLEHDLLPHTDKVRAFLDERSAAKKVTT